MKRYQIMVWSFTGIISFIFFFNTDCQGRFDHGICWVKISSTNSPCLWGYFLFWIVCMYAYQMWASTFAYLRLRKGLPLTFEIRKQCAIETFKCLFVYAIYLSFMMFCFAIISSLDPNPPIGSSLSNFSLFLLFIISNRGSVDGFVWFMLHDFQRDKMINYKKIDDNNDNDNNNNDNNNNNNNNNNNTHISSNHASLTKNNDANTNTKINILNGSKSDFSASSFESTSNNKNDDNKINKNNKNTPLENGDNGDLEENPEIITRSRRPSIFSTPLAGKLLLYFNFLQLLS